MAGLCAVSLVRVIRSAFIDAPVRVPAFRARRIRELASAPLRNRGFGRLAIVVAMVVAIPALAPSVGAGVGALIAIGAAIAVFLVLHTLIDR